MRSFAYGPTGLLGITDYTSGSPVTYVPVMDATGSIVELLDTSGNVVADYHYDASGIRTASGPAAGACPFGFAGMFQDATTGLYYDGARWYSASQGRFLARDPSGESGGLNLYAYCGNDPVNESDPTGLAPEDPWSLSLSGGPVGVSLPASGGSFDLSPDPYASLVGPQNTAWWFDTNNIPAFTNKQILAIDVAHKIDLVQTAARAKSAEAESLGAAASAALLDAQIAPYGADWRYQKAHDLLNASRQAQAVSTSLSNVANALVQQFGALGLGDVTLGQRMISTLDDYHGVFGPDSGLVGAMAMGHALAKHGPPSAVSDFGIFEAAVAVATFGDSAAITKLLELSLPEAAGAEAGSEGGLFSLLTRATPSKDAYLTPVLQSAHADGFLDLVNEINAAPGWQAGQVDSAVFRAYTGYDGGAVLLHGQRAFIFTDDVTVLSAIEEDAHWNLQIVNGRYTSMTDPAMELEAKLDVWARHSGFFSDEARQIYSQEIIDAAAAANRP